MRMTKQICAAAVLAALCGIGGEAMAHVVLQQKTAIVGSYYRATFQIGHGCAGSATNAVMIEIPDGVGAVRPMPKPGWTIKLENGPLPKPVNVHGTLQTEGVLRVTWSGGPLPDAWYDEFVLMSKLPEQTGRLYFKAHQLCEQGSTDWVQLPGTDGKTLTTPAPYVDVEVDTSGHAGHQH